MPNLREDRKVSGSLIATGSTPVAVSMAGMGSVMVQLTGTWTATVTFEMTIDEGASPTFVAVPGTLISTSVAATTATANGIYQVGVSGARTFRVRCSAFTSGTIVVTLNASAAAPGSGAGGAAVVSGTVTVQGVQAAGATISGNNPILQGFLGTGTTVRYMTAGPSLNNTTGVDAPGVIQMVKDTVGGNYFPAIGDASGRQVAVGAAAAAATVAGNPVYCGGTDGSSVATPFTFQSNASPNLRVAVFNSGNQAAVANSSVDTVTAAQGLKVNAEQYLYNGTNWDRQRSSQDVILHASAATGTGTVNTDVTVYNYNYLVIHANVTLYNAGTVLFKVQMQDANAVFVDIPLATTGAVAAGADIFLTVGPSAWGANATPVFYANQVLPRTIRIVQTVAAATVTFSAAYCLKN